MEKGDVNRLKGVLRTSHISQDANGDFWILKNNKLKCFSPIANISVLGYFNATTPPSSVDNLLVFKDSIIPQNNNDSITFFKINKADNRFYIAFKNKLGVYQNGTWQYHTPQNSNLPTGTIDKMFFASDGSIWINIFRHNCQARLGRMGIFRFDNRQWTNMTRYVSNSGLHDNYIRYIAFDQQFRKWVVSWCNEKILTYFDGNTWTDIDSSSVPSLDAIFSVKYNSDTLKIWNDETLLIRYEPQTKCFAVFDNRKKQSSAMKTDTQGNLWYATYNGLRKFNGTSWETYLAGNNIHALCFDHNNTLYANTLPEMGEKGIVFKIANSIVDTLATTISPQQPNTAAWVSSITVDNHNDLWFGVLWRQNVGYEYGGGLWHYSSSTQAFTPYHIYNSQIPGNSVVYVTTDVDNNVWVGTYGNGVGLFKNGVWTNINSHNSPLSGTSVEMIMQDNNKDIWFVSQWCGINLMPYSVESGAKDLSIKQEKQNIKIYPNPAINNEVTIEFDLDKSSLVNTCLYDIYGKLIVSTNEKLYSQGKQYEKISCPELLPKGIYLLKVKLGNNIVIKKIIIE